MAKPGKSSGRQERLAAALRENLKRRKARARELSGEGAQPEAEAAVRALESPSKDQNKAPKSS